MQQPLYVCVYVWAWACWGVLVRVYVCACACVCMCVCVCVAIALTSPGGIPRDLAGKNSHPGDQQDQCGAAGPLQ